MDEMQEYELGNFIENIPYTDINQWECCRLNIYTISQIMSKNKLSPKDIMRFPWDDYDKEEHKTTISDDEIVEMEKKVKEIQQKYYA